MSPENEGCLRPLQVFAIDGEKIPRRSENLIDTIIFELA